MSDLSQGNWPPLDGLTLAALHDRLAAFVIAARFTGIVEPEYFGVSLAERNFACVLLADEIIRIQDCIAVLTPPAPQATH